MQRPLICLELCLLSLLNSSFGDLLIRIMFFCVDLLVFFCFSSIKMSMNLRIKVSMNLRFEFNNELGLFELLIC